ncbi:hypothetical protein FJU30_14095 [Affinibrenneria salicis]|uniref:Uncharacterized protein n=1 Tax=Affinibrenneria salicis TaxID=2590031 RepID=A0A5J5FZ12_9GAMM|nr:hypothetical protein [Affinibrenneria salicis]KAA8999458.1 hypothetical protein FJU30_14095 [Affinibrenneria salicis]
MNQTELSALLQQSGFPHDSYSIGKDKDESLCLINDGLGWVMFYSERGRRSHPEYFQTEEAACAAFLASLKHMLGY